MTTPLDPEALEADAYRRAVAAARSRSMLRDPAARPSIIGQVNTANGYEAVACVIDLAHWIITGDRDSLSDVQIAEEEEP